MASSLGANTRIPKRNRSELMEFIRLDSPDAKEIFREAQRTNLIEKDTERIFRTISMCLVRNSELARRYERRRKSLRDQGRKPKELEDRLLFAEESWQGIQKVCKSGPHCEKTRNVLGDSQFGLHLNRNFDILLRYTACTKAEGIKFLLVFKVMFGKVKSVTPNLTNDKCTMEPTPNYDTHISLVKPDPEMGICDAQDHNLAYLYEYDEETTLPSMSPSQILPFAVLSLERTGEKIIGPLRTPWQKQRKKRQASINATFKQQLSEEGHTPTVSNVEISSKADLASAALREKSGEISTDSNGTCVKREDTRSSSLDDAHTSSYQTPRQKSTYGAGRRSTRTLRITRSNSLGQDEVNKNDSLIDIETAQQDYEEEADLQYTEYLWDPLLEPRSSDDTNVYMETEKSLQNRNCTLQTTESASEKSLILQRLKEIEQEIQVKQRKLKELRQSRSSGKSGESVTSEEDVVVDDIVTDDIIFSPKRVELGEDSDQPLDLSRTSTTLHKIKIKEEKPTPEYTVKNQSHCNVSVLITENISQQSGDVDANPEHEETTKAQLQTSKSGIETDASGDDCNKLKQETKVDLNHGNFEPSRDTPTPTLDEPQDICWMDTTEIPVVSKGSPNQCHNKRNDNTKRSKEEKDNDTGVNAYTKNKNPVPAIRSNTNDSTGRSQTEGSMKASSKKCSSFYESYIKKKKETMGDHFKLDDKADVSMDASHDPTYLNDAPLSRLTDNQDTERKPMSVAKHRMSETIDQQTVANTKQSSNANSAKSSQSGLPGYNNNDRVLNPRDPRIQKRTSQDTESTNGSVLHPQTNEKDKTQTKRADEDCIAKANQVDKSDKNSPTKTVSGYSDRVNCSKIQHESDSDDDHSILACSTCDNCSSSSSDEESKPVLKEMRVDDTICKSGQSLSSKQVDDIIFSVNVSKAAETHLSSEVEKTLQDLGDAIKVIQKKVVESDDNRSSSGMNSQTEEEMEVDTITNEIQQAISTIVTDRAVRQTNDIAAIKAPTVIEVNCVNIQEDVLENRAVHKIDQCAANLQNEKGSDSNISVNGTGVTPEKVVETNLQSGEPKINSSIELSTNDMDVSENLLRDDFKPRNQGFSSYMPDLDRKSGFQTISKTLFHDVVAIKKCQLTPEPQSEAIAIKKKATETVFDEKLAQIDDTVDNTVRKGHITNTEQETKITANTTSTDWILSQEIDKTLTEIKKKSCTLYPSHLLVKGNSSRGKEAENSTHESERSASQQRRSCDRNRSRSKSVTGSVTSDSHRKTSQRPRDISPIRDPGFVPFHERGILLTRYFKDRQKRLGLKWVDRRRSPSGFRVRAIQKAKLTLFKNFSSKDSSVKKQSAKTPVVKTEKVVKSEKKDSDDEDRPLWKPTYFSKPYFKNHRRRFTESRFHENRISSLKDRQGGKPWHKTRTSHPNNLIIDRHGMIISLDPPNNRRPHSRFRNDSVSDRRTRRDSVFSRHQNTSRSFQEQRESASRTDPPSSETTLSKAMTSLLKRVLFDGPRNDGSTEGKMADMIFEMVKKKVTANDNDQSSTLGNANLKLDETRGFDDLTVDLPPELLTAVRSEHSRDRSTSQDRRSNNWERREVYIDRKSSAICDDRKYVEQRRGSSQSSDTRESHGDRYHNRTDHRFDRHDRNDNTHHFGGARGRGRGRGRGRWNWIRGSFKKPFIRNTFNNNNDRQPFHRDSDKYQSRSFSFNTSRLKTGSEFSSRRGYHNSDFHNKPYERKFDTYSTDRKSHHRDSNRSRDSRDKSH